MTNNEAFTGIATLSNLGLAVDGANDALNGTSWVATVNSKNNTVYFTLKSSVTGLAFKSDYGDKSNKWIPAGILDNAGKTVTVNYDYALVVGDQRTIAYMVTPTNDYFTNCIWYDAKDPYGRNWENSDVDNEKWNTNNP